MKKINPPSPSPPKIQYVPQIAPTISSNFLSAESKELNESSLLISPLINYVTNRPPNHSKTRLQNFAKRVAEKICRVNKQCPQQNLSIYNHEYNRILSIDDQSLEEIKDALETVNEPSVAIQRKQNVCTMKTCA